MPARGPKNPYVAGPAITDDYGFYGRQKLIEEVVNTLTNTRQNAVVLHGQRRIGKTSILYRLKRDIILLQDHLPIFFDMQMHEGQSIANILANLAKKIADNLELRMPTPTVTDLIGDSHRFQQVFLPEIYPHLGHKRLLFLFDEFDVAVPTAAEKIPAADTLLGYLRSLKAEAQEHLAFVFVVGQRLELLTEGYLRLFKGAKTAPVGLLKEEDTYNLLIELGQEGNIDYAEDALAEIWALTSGHPYYTQLIGFEIFERLKKKQAKQALAIDVEDCLPEALEAGRGAIDWCWRGFRPIDQWVLSAVADLTDPQEIDPQKSINRTQIYDALKQNLLFVTESDSDYSCMQLILVDFLTDTGGTTGQYRFAIEFFRRWIVKYHSIQEAKRRMEEFNPEALGHYEFGLLRFEKGQFAKATEDYTQALKLNPNFTLARLALARAHVALGDIRSAIDQYEEAYKQDDDAREPLIEQRLTYAQDLINVGNDEAALAQIKRILKIQVDRIPARRLMSDIYLRRAQIYLESSDLTEALKVLQDLDEPNNLIQDAGVGQRIRDMWLSYSQTLVEQEPPNWDQAREVLKTLENWDLLDETVRVAYNKITLDQTQTFLKQDKLPEALSTLQAYLDPPPVEVKKLLLTWSQEQVKQQDWEQAEKVLKELRQLFRDADSKDALLNLYEEWGNTLLSEEKYDEAIEISGRIEGLENEPD